MCVCVYIYIYSCKRCDNDNRTKSVDGTITSEGSAYAALMPS